MDPEARAREKIDELLTTAGWTVQDRSALNLAAGRGVAARELSFLTGEPDYTLFVDGKAIGTIEAKPDGHPLAGVAEQSAKYAVGLPEGLPAWRRPLPFTFESTGVETHFTNRLDPEPRSPRHLRVPPARDPARVGASGEATHPAAPRDAAAPSPTTSGRPRSQAITNLERSFAANKPRALIQMATGSGKTFTAVNFVYRLIKFAKARRVLFLVDRGNLGEQTLKEFQQLPHPRRRPQVHRAVQRPAPHLEHPRPASPGSSSPPSSASTRCSGASRTPRPTSTTCQSMPPSGSTPSPFPSPTTRRSRSRPSTSSSPTSATAPSTTSGARCWNTSTPSSSASPPRPRSRPSASSTRTSSWSTATSSAVADGVNVDYDVYRIRTEHHASTAPRSRPGSTSIARDRLTRKTRWEQLDEDLTYEANQLDRDVVAEDQIRTVLTAFRDTPLHRHLPRPHRGAQDPHLRQGRLPRRRHRPHLPRGVRQGQRLLPEDHLPHHRRKARQTSSPSFRNSYNPRIAVTVDMIATGTDIKPLEIVFFMRSVVSQGLLRADEGPRRARHRRRPSCQAVTPDARRKTHFVIVDAVGVCERDKTDSRPLERKRRVPFDKLLEAVALGNREPEALESLAGRLLRLERLLDERSTRELKKLTDGPTLSTIASDILDALDPDTVQAKATQGKPPAHEPTEPELGQAQRALADDAVRILANRPQLRNWLIEFQRSSEQTIDTISKDAVIEAAFSAAALDAARGLVRSWEQFVAEHRDEITAIQLLYTDAKRLRYEQLKELADAIERPPRRWTTDALWSAYERLGRPAASSEANRCGQEAHPC